MNATDQERAHRHQFDNKRILEITKINNRIFSIDILRIVCAFLIVISGMFFSYILIIKDLTITGSLFAGGTILAAVAMFLNFQKKLPQPRK